MKSSAVRMPSIWVLSVFATAVFANPAEQTEKALQAGGRASGNASASAGHSLAATGQLTSGVVATPILASGAVAVSAGSAAMQAGKSLMDAANRRIGEPLPITEESVSILPPNKALQSPAKPNN